jgi:hypothetical protein
VSKTAAETSSGTDALIMVMKMIAGNNLSTSSLLYDFASALRMLPKRGRRQNPRTSKDELVQRSRLSFEVAHWGTATGDVFRSSAEASRKSCVKGTRKGCTTRREK